MWRHGPNEKDISVANIENGFIKLESVIATARLRRVGCSPWLGIAGIACSGEVVIKDGSKREGDEHNGSGTHNEKASGPPDVLAASHVRSSGTRNRAATRQTSN